MTNTKYDRKKDSRDDGQERHPRPKVKIKHSQISHYRHNNEYVLPIRHDEDYLSLVSNILK